MKILAAVVPSLVLTGLLIWKWAESSRLQQRLDSLDQEVRTLKVAAESKAALATARTPAADTAGEGALPGESEKQAKKQPNPLAEFGTAMAELMKNADTKQALKDLSEGALAELNGELLAILNLSPEQKMRFLEALAENKQQDDALGLRFLTAASLSPEERKAFLKEVEDIKKANKARLTEALADPEKVAQYERFKDSQPERDLLTTLKKPLESKGMAMSEDQEQRLMDLVYRERKAYPWEHDYADDSDLNPEKFTDAAIERLWGQVAEFDQKTDPKVAQILTPEQMKTYEAQRVQTRAIHKLTLNFVKGLFAPEK